MEEETENAFPACSRNAITALVPCYCKVRENEGRKGIVKSKCKKLYYFKRSVYSHSTYSSRALKGNV